MEPFDQLLIMSEPIIPKIKGLLHGGDYNPEQWPTEIWQCDMELMGATRFDVATIGVFSWAQLEPEDGVYTLDWMEEVLDLLHKNGRHAILATPSAAMPAWLAKQNPEVLRTGQDGTRVQHGNRVNFCWTSPVYRDKVQSMAQKLAERFGNHPALASWHVSNEYSDRCHCNLCQDAFRTWLRRKFNNDLDALNHAYWTTFWSHTFRNWDEIEIPGGPYGERSIIGLTLDWYRYSSDQIIDFYLKESAPLRQLSPDIPITTNLMGFYPVLNSQKLAEHLDYASWDSYPCFIDQPIDRNAWASVAMTHDLNRSLKGKPFLMIESTPDGSNWYPVMRLKRPGMHTLETAQAIAHGSEGVMYFQWRKGRGSSEQYHGAVIGHDGSDKTRVYREVCESGALLNQWSDIRGTQSLAKIGLIYDFEINWAIELTHAPRINGRDYLQTAKEHYLPIWEAGITTDVISSEADFSPYRVIIAPMLYMLKPGVAANIRQFIASGGTFIMTYWSGMVDENTLAFQNGYPNELRDVFGIWVEETDCLYDSERVRIRAVEGNSCGLVGQFEARQYCELIHLEGAEALATFDSEFYRGRPSVTRHDFGEGEAYFVASRNDEAFQSQFINLVIQRAGLEPALAAQTPNGVTVQVRSDEHNDYLFVLNCTEGEKSIPIKEVNLSELDGTPVVSNIILPPNGFRLLVRSKMRAEQSDPNSRLGAIL